VSAKTNMDRLNDIGFVGLIVLLFTGGLLTASFKIGSDKLHAGLKRLRQDLADIKFINTT